MGVIGNKGNTKGDNQGVILRTKDEKILFANDLISRGYRYTEVVKLLKTEMGVKTNATCYQIMRDVYILYKQGMDEYLMELKLNNLKRLENIMEECDKAGGLKNNELKLKIIQEINKLYGVYDERAVPTQEFRMVLNIANDDKGVEYGLSEE